MYYIYCTVISVLQNIFESELVYRIHFMSDRECARLRSHDPLWRPALSVQRAALHSRPGRQAMLRGARQDGPALALHRRRRPVRTMNINFLVSLLSRFVGRVIVHFAM